MENPSGENQPLTKKERWELRREERTNEQLRAKRNRMLKRSGIWALAAAAIGGSVLGLIVLVKNSESLKAFGELKVPVSESDWSMGPADAPVVIVEYGDFQCPACKSYHPVVKQLVSEYPDRVRLVYRHFPLSQVHANAEIASYAAEAAGRQGKFWEMHDLIFEHQDTWAKMGNDDARNEFINYAQSLGLDHERFLSDMDLPEIKDRVNAQLAGGLASQINSTPTFFLNGKKIQNPRTYDEFKKLVDETLLP